MRIRPLETLLFCCLRLAKAMDNRERGAANFDPAQVQNILVVSSTAIGDTLLSTPAIRAVRERYPQARIIALFNAKNMALFADNPHVDGVVPYHGGYRRFLRTVLALRTYRFDLALIFHGNEPQATPLAYLAGARFIFKLPVPRENAFLLSNSPVPIAGLHAVDVRLKTASLAACPPVGREMILAPAPEDENAVAAFLAGHNILPDAVLIGFQVGAANSYKMWPKECFIELGKRLVADLPAARLLITGSPSERWLCEDVAAGIGPSALSTAGEISLTSLRGLVSRMKVLVSNDTGTMHMAVALGTPTVSLFCPTDAATIGPSQDMHRHIVIQKFAPCAPCGTKRCQEPYCMETISVDEVYASVKELAYR